MKSRNFGCNATDIIRRESRQLMCTQENSEASLKVDREREFMEVWESCYVTAFEQNFRTSQSEFWISAFCQKAEI